MGQILKDFKELCNRGCGSVGARTRARQAVYDHLMRRHGIKATLGRQVQIRRVLDKAEEDVRLEAGGGPEGCGCGQPLFRHVDGYLACPACEQY